MCDWNPANVVCTNKKAQQVIQVLPILYYNTLPTEVVLVVFNKLPGQVLWSPAMI
jgi:hypothetical protein